VNCSGTTNHHGYITPLLTNWVLSRARGDLFPLFPIADTDVGRRELRSKIWQNIWLAPPGITELSHGPAPLDNMQAEFHGDKERRNWCGWSSLDGKKIKSETYKVLAVLGQTQDEPELADIVSSENHPVVLHRLRME